MHHTSLQSEDGRGAETSTSTHTPKDLKQSSTLFGSHYWRIAIGRVSEQTQFVTPLHSGRMLVTLSVSSSRRDARFRSRRSRTDPGALIWNLMGGADPGRTCEGALTLTATQRTNLEKVSITSFQLGAYLEVWTSSWRPSGRRPVPPV